MKKVNKENKYIRDGRSPIPKSENTSKAMSANKAKDTKPELMIRRKLFQEGLRGYRIHYKKVPGRPDICFTKRMIAIYVNGCFWHRCPRCNFPLPKNNESFWKNKFNNNMKRDRIKIEQLKSTGWRVIVIWECEINDENELTKAIHKIKRELNRS